MTTYPYSVIDPSQVFINYPDGAGPDEKVPIFINLQKPKGPDGKDRDQTVDASNHMRNAYTLGLPELELKVRPRQGKAVVVGAGPSVRDRLTDIRELARNKFNTVFAVNWTHTWLINNGIIPNACVFFEIDAEPGTILKTAHHGVTYYICSHCHESTFDQLKGFNCVLWHSIPNSDHEQAVHDALFKGSPLVGGGIGTFTRTLMLALVMGYRDFELFGCDSSFPDDGRTHIDGYETVADSEKDGIFVYAKNVLTDQVRRFRTIGPLLLQTEEFKTLCSASHQFFTLRVHGDGLLQFVHKSDYPDQYEE